MFHHTLSALPTDVVSQVTHAIDRAPEDELYTTLKSTVIRLLSGSQERRLQQLFSQTELGDRTPSQLLRHMRTLVGDANVDDTIFQQLWMRCLPSHIAACLASCSDKCDLEELAEKAERIQEYYDRPPFFQLAQPKPCPSKPQETEALTKILTKLDTLGRNSPPPKCGKQRLRSQNRINKPSNHKNRVCYYHRTYGDDAKKCQPECTYPKVDKASSQKKLQRQSVQTTTDFGNLLNRLLYVTDRNSKLKFLIDTGSEVSVIPRSTEKHFLHPIGLSLQAANNTKISIYGQKSLTLDFGLRCEFPFIFLIADVQKPIIGADFLSKLGLFVNFKDCSLHENLNSCHITCATDVPDSISLHVLIPTNHQFSDILPKFPSIFRAQAETLEPKHHITHHIITTGWPVYAKPRRLRPNKLQVAKQEFQPMVSLSIVRPSNGRDYRALNQITVSDCYPIPHVQVFFRQLNGKKLFSKLDLVRAYHQISMAPEYIANTAVITPFDLFEYLRVPFGLGKAAQLSQRFIDQVFPWFGFRLCLHR